MKLKTKNIARVREQGFVQDPDLKLQLSSFLESLPERVTLIINRRKHLLSKIYGYVESSMTPHCKVDLLQVNEARPGILTNPQCKGSRESDHMVMILTKNHNLRESAILRQMQLTGTPHTVFLLGRKAWPEIKAEHVFEIPNVKALYHLMYNLYNLQETQPLDSFFKRFALRE